MTQPAVRTAEEVDRAALDRFLRKAYSPEKATFLEKHGGWWHRGQHNRWVIEDGGEVAAYCAVIPTAVQVFGERVDAAWWVDLVVDSNYRGEGLQRALDEKVRAAAPLIVGFPNALAARIHRRHGWGVREDLEVRLLPLRPTEMVRTRASAGLVGAGLRLSALLVAPAARIFSRRLERFEPRWARVLDRPSAEALAEVFDRNWDAEVTTTFRDAEYLAWRYLEAPYRNELFVVVGGEGESPDVVTVIRVMRRGKGNVARVLDLFGALSEPEMVSDVLSLAAKHALTLGACQLTALSANQAISDSLRAAGFVVRTGARFCWTFGGRDLHSRIEGSFLHLALGDSDNDEP